MSTLLDADAISQATKSPGNARVLAWLAQQPEGSVFLSVVTLAEIRDGVDRLPQGKRRQRLDDWLLHELPVQFEGCIVDVDRAVADRAGALMAAARRTGRNPKWMDALIAATALVHGLEVATLNRKDFTSLGVNVVWF